MDATLQEQPSNPVGRPLKFQTPQALQEKIDEYFNYCDARTKKVWKEKTQEEILISNPEPYTMSGLAYWIGISRQGLIDYAHRDEFLDTIKRARARIEADQEQRLVDKDTFTSGIIFNLKNNFGWIEKSEVDETRTVNLNVTGMLDKVYDNSTIIESTSTT